MSRWSGRTRAGARPRRTGRLRLAVPIAVALLLAACGTSPVLERTSPPAPRLCPTASARDGAGLGSVAYVRSGALHVVDLATCMDRVLVASGARPPVTFSTSGGWIAFGRGSVVSVDGGPVVRSLGVPAISWEWSPTTDVLAGVTPKGGVVIGGPHRPPRGLYPNGSGIVAVRFSPRGHRLAVDVEGRSIAVASVSGAAGHTAYRIPPDQLAEVEMAGWSPDGRWVLYWRNAERSASLAADGLPLEAVPAAGGDPGDPVPVVDSMLVYSDFLTSCGDTVVAAAGADRYVTAGKRLVRLGPPRWKPVDLSNDPSRSWFWPACSPDGRWVAATATPNGEERRFGLADRTIWLVAADGSSRRLLVGTEGDRVADEAPRWSRDGRWLLFVRRERRSHAEGTLELARVEGEHASVVGGVATLPAGVGYYGHYGWLAASDWFQPSG
jgi:hypothetical protein